MAHIFDVRGSGGEFVLLGDALTLPSSFANNPAILPGSLRYNPLIGTIEMLAPGDNAVATWSSILTDANIAGSYLPITGGTLRGNLGVQGDITVTGTVKATNFDGIATSAEYGADLAERYHADAAYEPGTVLVIGGENEVTACTSPSSKVVAGIVSTRPAYPMNHAAGPDETHPMIALKGRVPCKVVGPIRKGDRLVTSRTPGHAMKAPANAPSCAVLGIALADFDGQQGVVEVKV